MEELNERKYCVYMHISPSDKKYIGITSISPPEDRWKNGHGYRHNEYFRRAINKYGWENFEHIIFAENLTKKEADHMETLLIAFYETTNQNKGYNIAVGGNVHIGRGENNPFYGKTHSEETKKKLRIIRSIPVVQLSLDGEYIKEFDSGKEASCITGIDEATINDCCIGKPHCKSGGGYLWVYKRDYHPDMNICYQNGHFVSVVQLDKNGEYIAEYSSIKKASHATNTRDTGIIMCCRGKYKTSGGFKWMYKEDWEEMQSAENTDRKN